MTLDQEEIKPFALSELIATLEEVWEDLRDQLPDLPRAVITVASGAEKGRMVMAGQWACWSWRCYDANKQEDVGEVLIAGESCKLGAPEVLHTLLHEAAHALATARKIKDHSRQGRYHNRRYADLAMEVGLEVATMGVYGWAKTDMTEALLDKYSAQITMLSLALRAHRHTPQDRVRLMGEDSEGAEDEQDERSKNAERVRNARLRRIHECDCPEPRRIDVSPAQASLGPIICSVCGQPFTRVHQEDEQQADEGEESAA